MVCIPIIGASGKVGKEIVELVSNSSDPCLTATKFVSQNSDSLSSKSASGSTQYFPVSLENLLKCDVVIDFSTPAATMQLLDLLEGTSLPLVIGTTGFSAEQAGRLDAAGAQRPILTGANFTYGFETFLTAGHELVSGIADAEVSIGEIYNKDKKPAPSGTTQRISRELAEIPTKDGKARHIALDIQRVGDTSGVNVVKLSLGFATIELKLTVHSREAYAAGAIAAAKWLINQPNGTYAPTDMVS